MKKEMGRIEFAPFSFCRGGSVWGFELIADNARCPQTVRSFYGEKWQLMIK